MDVSIIIVNYNNFDLLTTCLESLKKQTLNLSYEVIVVDNNSTEGYVEEHLKNCPNVILIKNEKNLGYASANNIGAKTASGKYLLILNNDVVFIENAIQKVFQFAEQQKEEVIIGCKLLNEDMSLQVSVSTFPSIWNIFTESLFMYKIFPKSRFFNKYYLNYNDIQKIIEVDVVKGAFLFCSRKTFNELKGFDERFYFYSEETDYCYRFKQKAGKVIYYPETSLIHLGGATTDKNLWFKYKNQTIAHIQWYQKCFHGVGFVIVLFSHYIGLLLRGLLYLVGGLLSMNKNLIIKSYYFFKRIFVYPKNVFN